jgi:hypothetical protein
MRLLAGVGSNALYEGLGLMAPLIAALLLFGLTSVFFVLLFCMAAAIVLYALSPFAFAGLVMAPTRTWFRKWATAMFSVLFAKVPIAILLALSVSLFANSAHTGTTQAFVNAGAGLILGIGALLAPLMAYGLFSFMGTVATKPAVPATNPARALGTAYYGSQMGRAGVNAGRKVVTSARSITTRPSAGGPGSGGTGQPGAAAPAPHEPTAAARSAGAPVTHPASTSAAASGAAAPGTAGATTASTGATGATAAAAGAATAGVGAVVIAGGAATSKATGSAKGAVVGAAGQVASPSGYTQHGSGLLVPDTPSRPSTPPPRQGASPDRESPARGSVGPPDAHRVT